MIAHIHGHHPNRLTELWCRDPDAAGMSLHRVDKILCNQRNLVVSRRIEWCGPLLQGRRGVTQDCLGGHAESSNLECVALEFAEAELHFLLHACQP